jgi:DNA-binding MarR family transcriptional regulator
LNRLRESKAGKPISIASAAAEIYGMRRARDQIISSALVGEPGWDILLALCVEYPDRLTVASVSQSFGVRTSTVLRWVQALEDRGLVHRKVPASAEATSIALTQDGCSLMERCLKVMLRATSE